MTTDVTPAPTEAPTEITMRKLRRLNIIAGFAHLAQMIAVLALTNDFALPVTATYMTGPPGSRNSGPDARSDVSLVVALLGPKLESLVLRRVKGPGGLMLGSLNPAATAWSSCAVVRGLLIDSLVVFDLP